MIRVPILYVEPVERGLRFRLDVPGHDPGGPVEEEVYQPIDAATLEALRRSADDLLHGGEHASFPAEARARGALVYASLVPERLRERLRAIDGPLLVASQLAGVPWELLHDGHEFWGVRYALGRRLLLDRPAPEPRPVLERERPRALVVGSDPRGDLPFVAREVERLCAVLGEDADVVGVSGPLATFDVVTAHLRDGFDLVHFCGHVVGEPSGGSALLLADGVPLSRLVVQTNLAGRPLVFLNGCASARGHEARAPGWEHLVTGVAHGFLLGGAAAVVATMSDVSDEHAAAFAARFWEHVLAGRAVGEALRRARADSRADARTARSPSWLAFALFGNPALEPRRRVVPPPPAATPSVPAPVPTAPVAAAPAPARSRARRRTAIAVAVAAVLAIVAVVTSRLAPHRTIAVGVVGVSVRAGPVPEWMREFTRDGIITVLAEVHAVEVFSKAKIDFLCETKGQCGIAAAEALGMTTMLQPSLSVSGDEVALEIEAVDVARNGVLVASERAQGPRDAMIALQNEVVLSILARLGIEPTADERRRILTERSDDKLQAYRMLTETLGTGNPEPPKSGPRPPEPRSDGSWWPFGAVAWADESGTDAAAIRAVLAHYRDALEARNVDGLATLQTSMTPEQRAALQRYFQNARDLTVAFSRIEVLVSGDDALATFTREDGFRDADTGEPTTLKVRMSMRLRRRPDGWKVDLSAPPAR